MTFRYFLIFLTFFNILLIFNFFVSIVFFAYKMSDANEKSHSMEYCNSLNNTEHTVENEVIRLINNHTEHLNSTDVCNRNDENNLTAIKNVFKAEYMAIAIIVLSIAVSFIILTTFRLVAL